MFIQHGAKQQCNSTLTESKRDVSLTLATVQRRCISQQHNKLHVVTVHPGPVLFDWKRHNTLSEKYLGIISSGQDGRANWKGDQSNPTTATPVPDSWSCCLPISVRGHYLIDSCVWTVRRTTGVIVGLFQSFLRRWTASLESATHISSLNGLCRDLQAPSEN